MSTVFAAVAENAIRHADMVQHLFPTVPGTIHTAVISLFVQTPSTQGSKYSILVVCDRDGSTLTVDSAWRVYHDEVELVGAASPVDVLARFAQKFGYETEVAGDRSTLFVSKVVRVARNEKVTHALGNGAKLEFVPNTNHDEANFEIVLAFSINDNAYFEQLRRHGVTADRPKENTIAISNRLMAPKFMTT